MKIQSVEGDEKVSGLRLVSQSETDAKSDTDGEKNFQLLPEGKEAEMEASELHNPESPVRDSTETFVPADGVFCSSWNCRKVQRWHDRWARHLLRKATSR